MLGAEVLHVEAIQRPDGMRLAAAGTFLDRDRWWEHSFFFLSINENKRDLTLDLNRPEGIALLEHLIARVRHRRRELHAARRRELRPRLGASARAQPAGDHAADAGVRAHRAVARPRRLRTDHGADLRARVRHRLSRRTADHPAGPLRPAGRHARRVRAHGRARRARGDGRRAARRGTAGRGRAAARRRAGRRVHRDRHRARTVGQPLPRRRAPGRLPRATVPSSGSPCRSRPTRSGLRSSTCSAARRGP